MVRSTKEEISHLRERALRRAHDRCEWPGCHSIVLEMAHIRPKGMGGSKEANTLENVWMLCRMHHDIFDGRQHAGLKRGLQELVTEVLRLRRLVGVYERSSRGD